MGKLTKPMDGKFYRSMARGHLERKGHVLKAVLVSTDGGELWRVERECC